MDGCERNTQHDRKIFKPLQERDSIPVARSFPTIQKLRDISDVRPLVSNAALQPFVLALANSEYPPERLLACLESARTLRWSGELWTSIYFGMAGAYTDSGRTPADRCEHEFGLVGYFRQAPALEGLFLVLRPSFQWTTKCSNSDVPQLYKLNIAFDRGRAEFLNWCASNVRCAMHERPQLTKDRAGRAVLEGDEAALCRELAPLLNVRKNKNDFRSWLTAERARFRLSHCKGALR